MIPARNEAGERAGRTDVTEATRWACRSIDRPFAILGLTS